MTDTHHLRSPTPAPGRMRRRGALAVVACFANPSCVRWPAVSGGVAAGASAAAAAAARRSRGGVPSAAAAPRSLLPSVAAGSFAAGGRLGARGVLSGGLGARTGAAPRALPDAPRRGGAATVRAVASASTPPTVSMAETAQDVLRSRVVAALTAAYGADAGANPMLTPATKAGFGDYQCNAALSLAKKQGQPPRDVAAAIIAALDVADLCEPPTVAGPGFINLTLQPAYVTGRLNAMLADLSRLGVARRSGAAAQKVIVDFSSPNIAKEMHVGHLRSTIIGDALCRMLEFLGHDVVRLNHVGDWGTQFGMLIQLLREEVPDFVGGSGDMGDLQLGDLVVFYKRAKARFDADPAFKEAAQREVVALQGGDAASLRAWQAICGQSRVEFQKLYDTLRVDVTERGESFYNPYLGDIIADLEGQGLAVQDQGATVVFLEGAQFINKDGSPQPVIVRKSDGGFNYATTDLAAMRYRVREDGAQRILYVTDIGQSLHFTQVFQVARRAGLVPPEVSLEHVPFGLVQGEDGKKFKTRSGDVVKLKDLLDEAVVRSRAELEARLAADGRTESPEYIADVVSKVGIAAVKYADLKTSRTSNYRFSFDKMVKLDGDTAPYMMYAFVRTQGIYREAGGGLALTDMEGKDVAFEYPVAAELALAKTLLRLPEVLAELERDLCPHVLCEYMKGVSTLFNRFYEQCPVRSAESAALKESRLALCAITASVIQRCLDLLGIETLDKI